jgi:hypothetical protein
MSQPAATVYLGVEVLVEDARPGRRLRRHHGGGVCGSFTAGIVGGGSTASGAVSARVMIQRNRSCTAQGSAGVTVDRLRATTALEGAGRDTVGRDVEVGHDVNRDLIAESRHRPDLALQLGLEPEHAEREVGILREALANGLLQPLTHAVFLNHLEDVVAHHQRDQLARTVLGIGSTAPAAARALWDASGRRHQSFPSVATGAARTHRRASRRAIAACS